MVAAVLSGLVAPSAPAADDGSQMRSRFRINYLGYPQPGDKLVLFNAPLVWNSWGAQHRAAELLAVAPAGK